MNQPPPRRSLSSQRTQQRAQSLGPLRDPRLIVAGGAGVLVVLILAVLFIGPCSILNPSDDGEAANFECPTIKNPPAPPENLERASDFKDFSAGKCNDREIPAGLVKITMPLERGKGGRGLVFYTYTDGKWQRVAPAELTPEGKAAEVTVDRIPANGVIMRPSPGATQVMATVPQGQSLHADGERLATVVGGIDFLPAADGSLNGNLTNIKRGDSALLAPVVRAGGGPEAEAVNAIVAAPDLRAAHAANLARLVQSNRLDGIELDYTQVDPARRGDFTDLVRQVAEAVHKNGGVLIVTMPLPVKDGNNWNTGAYDWNQIGKLADYIKIAPERDQSAYRKNVPETLTYLTGQVEPKKLILTLSPLSAEKSDQGIRTMSTLEALSIASQFSVRDRDRAAANSDVVVSADNLNQEGGAAGGLNWDAVAATVAFNYRSGESPRTIWIENQFSAGFKAEYASLWGLGGVAIDDGSNNEGLANIWPSIEPLTVKQPLVLQQPNSMLLRPEWLVDNNPYQVGRPVITWKTPAEGGNHTITLIVSDGQMRVSAATRVSLRSAGPSSSSPSPASSPTGSSGTPAPTATPRR